MQPQDIISSGLLELYAAGLTSPEETVQVEQWAKQYPEVAAELSEIQASIESYALAHAMEPDPSIKEKILSGILINTKEEAKVIPLPKKDIAGKVIQISVWKLVAAAAVLLLLGSIALNIIFYNKYDDASKNFADANKYLLQTQQQLADVSVSNKAMKEDMGVVQNKYSQPVSLHGMGAAPDAAAKVFWMKNTGEVYIDPSNLPELEPGKQFQLWAIVDGKPVDGGMILTSKKGDKYRIQKMKSFGKADAFAITIEKEGGSPTPSKDMVVMGKM